MAHRRLLALLVVCGLTSACVPARIVFLPIGGVVVNEETGEPVPDVVVWAIRHGYGFAEAPHEQGWDVTDSDGKFRIAAKAKWPLTILGSGYDWHPVLFAFHPDFGQSDHHRTDQLRISPDDSWKKGHRNRETAVGTLCMNIYADALCQAICESAFGKGEPLCE